MHRLLLLALSVFGWGAFGCGGASATTAATSETRSATAPGSPVSDAGTAAPPATATAPTRASGTPIWQLTAGGPGADWAEAVAVAPDGGVVVVGAFENTITFGETRLGGRGTSGLVVTVSDAGVRGWTRALASTGGFVEIEDVAVSRGGEVALFGQFAGTLRVGDDALHSAGDWDLFVAVLSPGGEPRFARSYGGAAREKAEGVIYTAAGELVVVGTAESSLSFGGSLLRASDVSGDGFVAGLTADGDHRFSRRIGGRGRDAVEAVASDLGGDVVIAGRFAREIDLGDGLVAAEGNGDGFVARLDRDGRLVWLRALGGPEHDAALGVAVDDQGRAAVVGSSRGELSIGGAALPAAGREDAFVAVYDADGVPLWARRFGDGAPQIAHAVAASADGTVYLTGEYRGDIDLGTGPLGVAPERGTSFLAAFDPGGDVLWSRRFGGIVWAGDRNLAIADYGHLYLVGQHWQGAALTDATLDVAGAHDLFILALEP